MKPLFHLLLALLVLSSPVIGQRRASSPAAKEETKKDPMSTATFNGLKLRSIGPATAGGRVAAFAVNPRNHSEYYAAVASGGVWKTTNSGTTWTPVFDNEGSYSIGAITLDPANPLVVWVGTGENNSQRSVSYGDGVYRSDDGGKSWKNMGLKKSEHIARILLDPRNSDIIYVAAQGPLWGPGGDRGLYKSNDGGKTWKGILSISENTGVTDVVMDPRNPDVLYAASYQRRRHVWTLIDGGPESAIYKSTDAGATWTKLKNGLPSVDLGRIGLAVSPVDPRIVYATIEAAEKKSGFFRSTDYGASWEKRSDYLAGSPQYYQTIVADPKDVDRVYLMDTFLMVTDDGGKTFTRLGERSKHVDNHAMWIDPDNTDYYLVGCDGGVYESFDRGQNWRFLSNLPTLQFYDVTVDNATPFYNVYGGTQDNNTFGGPSRTRSASGITNTDWFIVTGGDGFQARVDPEDPNTVYGESQYGGLVRYDRRTGQELGIQPQPGKGEEPLRWNWDSPILISPHSHTRLYFAANRLYRSDDQGNSWKAVSGELSRGIDRNKLPVMGKIWGPDAVAKNASTSFYGNATALSESPKKEGFLYIGTDDGVINVTEDGGATWRRIEKFPGVPETTYVSRIVASQHEVGTVYAAFDNHKQSDFKPYLLKSTDAGRTWKSVAGDLPSNGTVWAIAEDDVDSNLLFAGTEFGLYFTIDGGQKWIRLKGGLPTIAVRDLAIQKRENDLVLATFGRGFYVLDDYTPLRQLQREMLTKECVCFPVKDAMMYIESHPLGGRGKASQGESFFTAPNPPFGATLTYYLKERLKTKKELRQEAEKEAEKKGITLPYPTPEQLRAEDEEEPPAIILTVTDASGNVVRRLAGANAPGMQRMTWDLRWPAPMLQTQRRGGGGEGGPSGPLVMPGTYKAFVAKRVNGVTTPLTEPQSLTVYVEGVSGMPAEDRKILVEFQEKVARLQGATYGAVQAASELLTRLGLMKRALQETPAADEGLQKDAFAIEGRLNEILQALRGDRTMAARNENVPPSISERVNGVVGNERMSTAAPTQTDKDAYAIASQELTQELTKLRTLIEVDVAKLEKEMEAAGAPWTPGRIPEWKEQ
jgi:photosystem II stability/assembly factor-like uncharacterized protein